MIYLLLLMEGILAFISPCILPMVPIYLIYLGGDREKSSTRSKPIKYRALNTLAFVFGFTLIFVLLGAVATSIGAYLNQHLSSIRLLSGIVMLIIGIYYLDFIHLPDFIRSKYSKRERNEKSGILEKETGLLRSFLFGMAFSSTWLPCVGTFLASALTLAANRSTVIEGMFMLFVFSMGLGIPFLITSLLFEKLRSAFNFLKKHARTIRIISGLLLILLGISMLFNVHTLYLAFFN